MSYVATSPPIVDVTTRKLFAHLWRGGPFAYYWTASEAKRQDKPKEALEKLSFWFATDDPGPLPGDHGPAGPRHLYFSVNPTQARGSEYQRAKRDARPVAAINTLFGEFDYKDFASPAAAVAHVESLHPKPSVIISSGGGLHCYWLLTQPFVLSGEEQYQRAKNAQYAWVDHVKSDGDAKDLARVLRIPGSLNYKPKYGPDFPTVTILRADFDRLYSLRELEQLCQPRSAQPKPRRDNRISDWTTDLHTAADCLKRLNKWRVEQYQPWLEVGMSLKAFGDAGLKLWDEWSQGSQKYDRDECESKWATFAADGLGLGSLIHWANEDDPKPKAARRSPKPSAAAQPGPLELKRRALAEKYRAEAQAERAAKEAAKQTAAEARQAELQRRWEAGNPIQFDDDEEEIDPDYIEYKRAQFTNAKKWRDYVLAHWPQVSDRVQYEIKLKENREARPHKCGEWRKKTLPNGQIVTTRWTCGVCYQCLKRGVWTYRRALNEIQGIATAAPDDDMLPGTKKPRVIQPWDFGPEDEEARPLAISTRRHTAAWIEPKDGGLIFPDDDNREEFTRPAQPEPIDDAPRENAPPLPQVKGKLSIVRIWGDKERLRLGRELRTGGISHKSFPITLEDGPAYDFIINDDRGDPLGLVTDERIALWVKGVEGKRAGGPNKKKKAGPAAAGPLLPSLKELQERYRKALPYEVVMPELDDEGQPVDPDIFALELPDIGTTAPLPGVTVDFEVNDAASLQAALLEIHREQWRILGRRGNVNYGVCVHKKFYTRYSTLPAMLADFNAAQEAIKQRRRKK